MRFLVFDAPGADCVTNVAASEFDLGVIAHSGQKNVGDFVFSMVNCDGTNLLS